MAFLALASQVDQSGLDVPRPLGPHLLDRYWGGVRRVRDQEANCEFLPSQSASQNAFSRSVILSSVVLCVSHLNFFFLFPRSFLDRFCYFALEFRQLFFFSEQQLPRSPTSHRVPSTRLKSTSSDLLLPYFAVEAPSTNI